MEWQGLIGLALIPLVVWLLSEDRAAARSPGMLGFMVGALALQAAIGVILLTFPPARTAFVWFGEAVTVLQRATDDGARLVFGHLAGGPSPYDTTRPEHGYVLAFRMLPMILVVAALMRLMFYWCVLQRVVAGFAFLLRRTIGIGGPLATVASASIFLGPVEAPLLIRPYVAAMGRGALFATMTVGMATVAGTVLALYASILAPQMPDAAGHLLTASIMNVPAALLLARLAVPDGFQAGEAARSFTIADESQSSMDAVTRGTLEGLAIAAAVGAMLVVAVALVSLVNAFLGAAGAPFGVAPTLQSVLGVLAAPLAWVIGIPWSEAPAAGALLGQKFVLNEFIAYLDLAATPAGVLSERTRLILGYALCSFANLGSLGILIGGLSAMVPERRSEIVALGPKALVVGYLATLMSAAIIGLVVRT
ncbi:MAG: NupC/NupG family nucleoside CNT transporter [Hyphomicrobium sp.]